MRLLSLLPLLAAAGTALAADVWTFEDGSVAVGGKKESLSATKPLSRQITLCTTDTLKLLLTTQSGSDPKRPHQAHLLLTSANNSNLETAYPLTVRDSGRATLSLSSSDLPLNLLSTPLKTSLVLGSFGEAKPSITEVFTVTINGGEEIKRLVAPERYAAKPEIHHYFKEDQKSPPKIISLVFTLAVLATLPILFIAWALLGANLKGLGSAIKTAPLAHTTFYGSLLALEGVFGMYYYSWRLFKVLPIVGAIGVVACLSGSKALSEVQKRRVAGQR